jgi:TPR repeat protein
MQRDSNLDLSELESRAARNDAHAQVELARLLDAAGRGEQSAVWLRRAADSGNAVANATLGAWLLLGYNVERDETASIRRLLAASAQGDDAAPAFLATLHAAGLVVDHDWRKAGEWLVAAAMRGNDKAQMQLALLADETERELRPRLLFSAAARGNAIAPYFLGKALRDTGRADASTSARLWLRIAATAGNPCALLLEEPLPAPAALPPPPVFDAAFWDRTREAFDPQRFLAPPTTRVLNESPLLAAGSALLPSSWCEYLMVSAVPFLERAGVNDIKGGTGEHEIRTNSHAQLGLTRTDVVGVLAARRIAQMVSEPFFHQEDAVVLHYRPGEAYDDHQDFIDPRVPAFQHELATRGQRVATVLVYLNAQYTGGETEFPRLGLSHRGRQGDALAFRNVTPAGVPDDRTLHAGRPPTTGTKWLLSKWIRDRRQVGRHFE